MLFCDKDIVAARPNLAFVTFSAGPHRRFGTAMGYLRYNSCSPSFADSCSDSEAVLARGTPEHRTHRPRQPNALPVVLLSFFQSHCRNFAKTLGPIRFVFSMVGACPLRSTRCLEDR
jgi:hypothetical protein